MKKLLTIFISVALLVLTACQREEWQIEHAEVIGPEFKAQAEAFNADMKTALADGHSIVWSAGDDIAIFQGTASADKYQVDEDCAGTSEGVFSIEAKGEAATAESFNANIAIYPYQDGLTVTATAVAEYQISGVTVPSIQTYASDTFANGSFLMTAITDDLDDRTLNFRNLCGALKLQLKGTAKIQSIELQGNDGEPLSGEGTVTLHPDGSIPSLLMGENAARSVTLDCGAGVQLNETTATDFLIAIPPTAFEKGFTAIITGVDGGIAKIETDKSNVVGRSYVHEMPEIKVGINHFVPKSKDESIKILCFGSSWFLNTWWYLNKITSDLGINAEIHGYYVGHSCFDEWIALYNDDLSPFEGSESSRQSYRYVSVNGANYTSSKRVSGGEYGNQEYRDDWYNDLTTGDWDIIAFQQGAHQSPQWTYWQNGDQLVSLIRKHAGNDTVIAFNNTWTPSITSSYLPGDTDGLCGNTLEGQMLWQTMNYDNCKRFMNLTGVNSVSPNGAMFYTLRRDSMINIDGDDLCYDGLHPNYGLPMFALASVFYETFIAPFYGVSIDECDWLPTSSDKKGPFNNSVFRPVSELQRERIHQYVHMSLDNMFGFNEPLPAIEDTDWIQVQGTEVLNVMPQNNGYAASSSGLVTEYSGYDWSEYDIRVTCRFGTNASMYAGCLWGENDTYLGGFWKSTGTAEIFDKVILTDDDLPEGVAWSDIVKIGLSSSTTTNTPLRYSALEIRPKEVVEVKTYKPYVELGALSTLGVWARNFYERQYYRTPRYMRVTDSTVEVAVKEDCDVRVCQYDADYKFIKIIDFTSVKASEAKTFALASTCEYIRLVFCKDSSLPNFALPEVSVSNVDGKEYFELRSSDEGYQKILAHIEVDGEILPDYGVVCLPETYSNVGEPTRLIIFCHGAAVNYPSSVSRFVASDINPEYWLKEGYAIMDIEGNPFDNTNEHFYIPQAIQCYKAAYDWVTSTYNIRTDGVFLGGRSMGGGMCFEILRSDIPVIAACPVVPACNQLWYWNYANADRKTFCSEKMGFTGTQPAWTSNKKLTDAEYDYLYANFDQMLACSPFWSGIENLPSKDELFSVGRVSANVAYDEAEANLYSTLKFRAKAPVKIFTCYEDSTVPYRRNAELMYNMMVNAGMECELSLVHTDAATPHRYEQQDSNANITVTTRYGETLSAPWVYVDMVEFWRRYEPTRD